VRVFLDTSVLSEANLSRLSELVLQRYMKGDQFFLSSITHFQIVWGYSAAKKSASRYREFLKGFRIDVTPVTKSDAEDAADVKPSESDILDALIASSVKRYGASLWTGDRDFFKFLPKSKVQFFS
jgi:predicted nucleic acid-binding protein